MTRYRRIRSYVVTSCGTVGVRALVVGPLHVSQTSAAGGRVCLFGHVVHRAATEADAIAWAEAHQQDISAALEALRRACGLADHGHDDAGALAAPDKRTSLD